MATGLSLIVDNVDASKPKDLNVSIRARPFFYKQTAYSSDDPYSFLFSFEGTSVAFIGANITDYMKVSDLRRWTTTQIDNGTVFRMNEIPQAYSQWFQSPTLPDGPHTINVTLGTVILDFAIVNAGNETRLAGRDVIVDNDSPSIVYSGHWNRSTSAFRSNILNMVGFPVYPYGNSTHRSSTPGDSFTFRFTGTSVAIYGMSSFFNEGTLAATYTVDGVTISYCTYNKTELLNIADGPGDVLNFLYYSLDDLPAGDHTLIVNVTLANHLAFTLDYITYKPSFQKLSSMPLLNSTTPTTSTKSLTTLGNPSSTQTSQARTSDTPKSSPTPAIVGGVIGVLAFVVILTAWLFLERRRTKRNENLPPYSHGLTDEDNYRDGAINSDMSQLQPQTNPQPMKYRRLDLAVPEEPDPHLPLSSYPPPNIDNPPSKLSPNPPHYFITAI